MAYLLDTHTLLWLLDDETSIPSATLSQLKNPANALYVSSASIWEIAIKRSLGKLTLNRPTQALIDELPRVGITLLPVLSSHILQVETLPFHHKDPFDRIIIAQALVENWSVVSRDTNFPLYPVQVLWT
ncbi:PIN domain nuclease of toxin-antitoxin system [Spirosoma lacussanchae]|uniref:type II toxin-antitoxin system VapC family toxin n=1 Tax=Spirosoma lacussanchae TaxID=1884249 RepID=UPI001109AD6F|nr:type II toxin-antitoxin system VapC family toxin [Spirosoma lacussanchae]